MRAMRATVLLFLVTLLAAPAVLAEERIDYDMVTRIRQEGFRNSKVMEIASALCDGIGARLTGSPDLYERLQREDLMQASVVMATFVWEAAMRDSRLPRKPLPKENPPPGPTHRAVANLREASAPH
jgi:hypothetical protein